MALLPPLLQTHFLDPRQVGDPSRAPARGQAANRACGDHLELGLWVEDGRVSDARFRAQACSAVIAGASLTCESVLGRALEDLAQLDVGELCGRSGGLPPGKAHAASVVERALRQAVEEALPRYPGRA